MINHLKINNRLEQAINAYLTADEHLDDVYEDLVDLYDPNEYLMLELRDNLNNIVDILSQLKEENNLNYSTGCNYE